jgi:hypothetical protein
MRSFPTRFRRKTSEIGRRHDKKRDHAAGTSGTIRLVKIAGIQVYLHWSWFLVALYEIQYRNRYASLTWTILEYVSLFAIVTLHEFGHALACRQVGGRAEQIVLWPLGGVAYVNAPPRPAPLCGVSRQVRSSMSH